MPILGLDADTVTDQHFLDFGGCFQGKQSCLALRYHGHQFGQYNPYLGCVVATEELNPLRRKKPTLVYPAYAKLTVGDVRSDGTLRSNHKDTIRVDLWVQTEPDNADQLRVI